MKNFAFVLSVLVIAISLMGFDASDNNLYTVLKVKTGDTFYVDTNKNAVCEPGELFKLSDVDSFSTRLTPIAKGQAKILKASPVQVITLGYLGEKFSADQLLGKTIRLEIVDKQSRPQKAKIFIDDVDFSQTLYQGGFALRCNRVEKAKIQSNLLASKNLNLVLFNQKSLKYHALDCKYAQNSPNIELMPLSDAEKIGQPCGYCLADKHFSSNYRDLTPQSYNPPNEPNVPYFTDGVVSLYVTNPNLFMDAPDVCRTAICKALLACINSSQSSIDFATYGVEGQRKIISALLQAQQRNVDVRWVTDAMPNGNSIYPNTKETMQLLRNVATDFSSNASALMHNKFFIFDRKTILAGSANLSNTDLTGLNANVFIKINSEAVANVFEKEFEQMYSGFFHSAKSEIPNKTNIRLSNQNVVSVYFSPKDRIISTTIVPLINDAHNYIYMPVFFLTDKSVGQALIDARKRGVQVRVILDAVAAENAYSQHKALRAAGIAVKVEDWAGKMHQKSMIIDDDTVVIGSMNFSKSGNVKNDENCVVVQNAPALAKKYKQYFLMLYNSIPNKWLTRDPRPESPDSIGSCFDHVDNDFDGKIDADDSGCYRALRKKG